MSKEKKCTIYLIRHEERYDNGLIDCSLTDRGLYNAQNIVNDKLVKQNIEHFNIYCSPFLRTMQTIFPYVFNICEKYNNSLSFCLEDSLYELINHNISHYFKYDPKPRIEGRINFFYYECSLIDQLYSEISNDKFENAKKIAITFLTFLNNCTYEKEEIIKILNDLIILLDKNILTKENTHIEFNNLRMRLYDKFKDTIMNTYINSDYTSLININKYNEDKINKKESFEMLLNRTRLLCKNILDNSKYQNSIYVSHQSVIYAIIINLFKVKFDNKWKMMFLKKFKVESYNNFFLNYPIDQGDILKIEITQFDICIKKI